MSATDRVEFRNVTAADLEPGRLRGPGDDGLHEGIHLQKPARLNIFLCFRRKLATGGILFLAVRACVRPSVIIY